MINQNPTKKSPKQPVSTESSLPGLPAGLLSRLFSARHALRENRPLLHCITNPISINDCANAILAVGARPIMAEHPLEVRGITQSAQALSLNLGNITDARMESMRISGETARSLPIPCVLDAVGTACSPLRLGYALECIQICRPSVVKGNVSELRALCGAASHAIGVDAGKQDAVSSRNRGEIFSLFSSFSREHGCVVFCTGPEDLIVDAVDSPTGSHSKAAVLQNGSPALGWITGTGCMVGALTGAFSAEASPFEACILAAAVMGIGGEKAAAASSVKGPGSFRSELLDSLFTLTDEDLLSSLRLGIYEKGMDPESGWALSAASPKYSP